jgi:hypothetical protein
VVTANGHQSIKTDRDNLSSMERKLSLKGANFLHEGMVHMNCLRKIKLNINITNVVDDPFEANNISEETRDGKDDNLVPIGDPSPTRDWRKKRGDRSAHIKAAQVLHGYADEHTNQQVG